MNNSHNIIGNRTHDHLARRAVPQSTALPRAPETVRDDGNDYNEYDFLSRANYVVMPEFFKCLGQCQFIL